MKIDYKKWYTVSMILLVSNVSHAQIPTNSTIIDSLYKWQCKGDKLYADGLFKSQRRHRISKKKHEDNNVFFSATIAYILQENYDKLDTINQTKVKTILDNIRSTYPAYNKKHDNMAYNFWPEGDKRHFPGNRFLSENNRFKLPDDFDDTALIWLTKYKDDTLYMHLRQEMYQYANVSGNKNKAYPTWFSYKMPIEHDLCVLSNTVLLTNRYHWPLNKNDVVTLQYILEKIMQDKHIKNTYLSSPHYQNPNIVLYHLARSLSQYNDTSMGFLKQKLKADIKKRLSRKTNFIEKTILSNAMMTLGHRTENLIFPKTMDNDINNFSYFYANLASTFPPFLKFVFGKSIFFNFSYTCKPHAYALMLEYNVLKDENGSLNFTK